MYPEHEQDVFKAPVSIDPGAVALHRHPGAPDDGSRFTARPLLLFIHGLGGSGYGTWDNTLPLLYDDSWFGVTVDVAIFYYESAWRRFPERVSGDSDDWVEQIAQAVRRFEEQYDHIFLVGHSLGGVLAARAARLYVESLGRDRGSDTGALAGVLFCASPRAGSRWASMPGASLTTEGRALKPMSKTLSDMESWFSSRVWQHVVGVTPEALYGLPTFALVAAGDTWVNTFSAKLGVPELQRLTIAGTHGSIVKATGKTDGIIDFITRKMVRDRLSQRIAEARLRSDSENRQRITVSPAQTNTVVAQLWTDADGFRWEGVYHEAVQALSDPTMLVTRHSRDVEHVDVQFSILTSARAQAMTTSIQAQLRAPYDLHPNAATRDLTVTPVGPDHEAATSKIEEWLDENVSSLNTDVVGATDDEHLRVILAEKLQRVIWRKWPRLLRRSSDPLDSTGFDQRSLGGYL